MHDFEESGTVTWVSDGDTVTVSNASGDIEVRFAGINAPEDDECFGDVSRDHLIDTLKDREVELEVIGTDQFGRTLAYVWEGDRNVNLELVKLGLAIATTPDSDQPPGPDFLEAESSAVLHSLGLWGEDACGGGPLPDVVIDVGSSVFNAPGPDDDNLAGEQITIRNDDDKKVNLTGWVLRDESSRHRYTFPNGTRLEPGKSITIESDDPGWDPGGSPVWNNKGDMAMLLNRDGRVVDVWRYDE